MHTSIDKILLGFLYLTIILYENATAAAAHTNKQKNRYIFILSNIQPKNHYFMSMGLAGLNRNYTCMLSTYATR